MTAPRTRRMQLAEYFSLGPWTFLLAQLLRWLSRLLMHLSRRAHVEVTEPEPVDEGDEELPRVGSEIGEPGIPVSGQDSDEMSSRTPTSPCSHCRTIRPDSPPGIFPQAFHEDCDRCPSPQTTMASFCPFWQHLRLEHVYKCCLSSGLRSDLVYFDDFQPCPQCPGCRAIRKGITCSRINKPPQASIGLVFDFFYGNSRGYSNSNSNPKPWVRLTIRQYIRTIPVGDFATISLYGDYHESSVSGDILVEEKRLHDSDWISLREQLEDISHANAHGIEGLRVIDVQEACITMAPANCEYVTLSYVWGSSDAARRSLRATSANIRTLEVPGRLNAQDVPATIKDAMTACAKLWKRYLWVDRLCILQDDPGDMINVMGNIYSRSAFTIVASANVDALEPIPGISGNQLLPFELRVPGWRFLEDSQDQNNEPSRSEWSTRGWTYQEEHLSKRLLYFCKHKAYVQEPSRLYITSFERINHYSQRQLSSPKDKISAFTNILNRSYGQSHRCGMPFEEFDHAILWFPSNISRNEHFPSWSWASVRSAGCDRFYHKYIGVPIASWAFYAKGAGGGVHLTSITTEVQYWHLSSPAIGFDDYGQVARVLRASSILAWREGCFTPSMPPGFRPNMTWNELQERVYSTWMGYEQFSTATRPPGLDQLLMDKALGTNLNPESVSRRVLVHTQCPTFFYLSPTEKIQTLGFVRLLTPNDNVLRGWIFLDRPSDDYERLVSAGNGQTQIEVLALSVAQATEEQRNLYFEISGISPFCWEEDAHGDVRYFDSEGAIIDPWKRPPVVVLNIMLVENHGDTYRRVGLGVALLKRWKETRPRFSTFILD